MDSDDEELEREMEKEVIEDERKEVSHYHHIDQHYLIITLNPILPLYSLILPPTLVLILSHLLDQEVHQHLKGTNFDLLFYLFLTYINHDFIK